MISPYAASFTKGATELCGITSTVGASVAPCSAKKSTLLPEVPDSRTVFFTNYVNAVERPSGFDAKPVPTFPLATATYD